MSSSTFSSSPYLILRETIHGGRSIFAQSAIPAGTIVHTSASPYASVIYREFRKEVCAWCFAYDGRKGWKISDEDMGGQRFCSETCKASWTLDDQRANAIQQRVRKALDGAARRLQKLKQPPPLDDPLTMVSHDTTLALALESFDAVWSKVESQDFVGVDTFLEGLELDMARFVASALAQHHIYSSSSDSDDPVLSLQANELHHITERPYILPTHIRIYRFLRSALSSIPEMKTYFGGADGYLNWVRAILNRDVGNSFGIWEEVDEGDRDMFGWGVWVDASFFNHSTPFPPSTPTFALPVLTYLRGRLLAQPDQTPLRSSISLQNKAGYRTRRRALY